MGGWAVATAGGRGEAGKNGNDDELAWHRERDIAAMEEMWEPEGEPREPDP